MINGYILIFTVFGEVGPKERCYSLSNSRSLLDDLVEYTLYSFYSQVCFNFGNLDIFMSTR